jgi:hypothetical protein
MPTRVAACNARPPSRRVAFIITSITVIRTICRAGPGQNEFQRSTPGITALLARNETHPGHAPHLCLQLAEAGSSTVACVFRWPSRRGMGTRLRSQVGPANDPRQQRRAVARRVVCHHRTILSADPWADHVPVPSFIVRPAHGVHPARYILVPTPGRTVRNCHSARA